MKLLKNKKKGNETHELGNGGIIPDHRIISGGPTVSPHKETIFTEAQFKELDKLVGEGK